jgi:hypothetical protein
LNGIIPCGVTQIGKDVGEIKDIDALIIEIGYIKSGSLQIGISLEKGVVISKNITFRQIIDVGKLSGGAINKP